HPEILGAPPTPVKLRLSPRFPLRTGGCPIRRLCTRGFVLGCRTPLSFSALEGRFPGGEVFFSSSLFPLALSLSSSCYPHPLPRPVPLLTPSKSQILSPTKNSLKPPTPLHHLVSPPIPLPPPANPSLPPPPQSPSDDGTKTALVEIAGNATLDSSAFQYLT